MGWLATTAVGGLLVITTLWDALTTTVNVTERIGFVARSILAITQRPLDAMLRHGARPAAALLQVVLVILTWMGLLWLGWWLVLLGSPMEFVHAANGERAGALDTFYVAGFGIFALGVGDISPTTPVAQVLLVISAGTGLVLVTLVVTYLLSLTQAVTHKRHVARLVRSLGEGPEEIAEHAWDGTSFRPAAATLQEVAHQLALLAQHHITFTMLHQLGTHRPDLTLGSRLVDILDAVHLMRAPHGGARIDELTSHQLRAGMAELVRAIPLRRTPDELALAPEPDLGVLERLGVTSTGVQVDAHLDASLRRQLHGLAAAEGWSPDTTARGA